MPLLSDASSLLTSQFEQEFFSFLEGLRPEQWAVRVNNDWSVKDVIAHLVGWEKESATVLLEQWHSKSPAWFLKTSDYTEFNRLSVEYYRDFSGPELLSEWRKWRNELSSEICRIGEANLRAKEDLFDWVFSADRETPDLNGEVGHYIEHYRQIKEALGIT